MAPCYLGLDVHLEHTAMRIRDRDGKRAKRQTIRGSCAILAVLMLGCMVGCGGGSPAGVSGQVWFEGEPVMTGAIRFFPIRGTAGVGGGTLIEEGRYEIVEDNRMQAGTYRISIAATRATGKKIRPHEVLEGEPAMVDEIVQYIPRRFNRKSELTVKLKQGHNECDFDLKLKE